MQVSERAGLPFEKSTKSFWHSQPSTLLLGHRSTRDLPHSVDTIVIGSGITGASIAYHLCDAKSDDNVLMLEAREACWGATGRNGGHCQPLLFEHPDDPSIGRFELKNYEAIAHLAEHRKIDCEFVRQPGVRAIYGQAMLDQAKQAINLAKQTSPELADMMHIITDKAELKQYHLDSADGAMYTTVAARLWPYKLVAAVLERLITNPEYTGRFNLQTSTPVTAIEQASAGHWIVTTNRGNVNARAVFLATNGYTSHLLPSFSSLITPCRGQMSALVPPPSLSAEKRLRTSVGFEGAGLDDYLIQRPQPAGQLMFGGGRAIAPSLGITDDSVIDDKVARYLRTALPKQLQLSDGKDNELKAEYEWTGIMGWSKDGVPWVGKVPGKQNLYMSAGYTGHGMPNAWLCGKAVTIMHLNKTLGEYTATTFAQKATGLPASYLINEKRMSRAPMPPDTHFPKPQSVGQEKSHGAF